MKDTGKGIEREREEREQNLKSTLMIKKLRNVCTLLAQINTFQTVNSQKTSYVPYLGSSAIYRHKKCFGLSDLAYQLIPTDQMLLYLSVSKSHNNSHRCNLILSTIFY